NWKTGYTQEWNTTIQYEPTPSQTITLGYVANTSRHLLNGIKRNQPDVLLQKPLPQGLSGASYDPFPDFANNSDFIAPNGDAFYYSFQSSYERRSSRGYQALVDYTYSRCMSDARNILNSFGDTFFDRLGGGTVPGYSIKEDYHFCGSDVPNLFHASGILPLPFGRGRAFGKNMSRPLDALAGGWQAQGIWTVESGFPFYVGCSTVPISNPSSQTCDPDLTGQPLYLQKGPNGGINEFLNPNAFADPPSCIPPAGSTDGIGCTNGFAVLGGRPYQAHGPTFDNGLDFSMFKDFKFTESSYLEFQAEFFNLTNHTSFGNPGNVNSYLSAQQNAAAGKPVTYANITGTASLYNPRTIEFALKFYW
ncbi:MAG: hypothetical protein ACRD2G_18325, partial [Terriglobia bacterium]